jgi:Rieske Fe-S protein
VEKKMVSRTSQVHLNRRDFIKVVMTTLGSIMGIFIGLPIVAYIISPALIKQEIEEWIPIGSLEDFPLGIPTLNNFTRTKVNGWETTSKSYGLYVWRKSNAELVVFSNVCTHLSCLASWQEDVNEYVCPCHDGHYDIDGNVTKGPPPRPLDRYEHKIEDGFISVHLLEG